MKKTVFIEIPVTISFFIDPGQEQTLDDPGYPVQVEDIMYSHAQVIDALDHELYGEGSTIEEELIELVENDKWDYDMNQAEGGQNENG